MAGHSTRRNPSRVWLRGRQGELVATPLIIATREISAVTNRGPSAGFRVDRNRNSGNSLVAPITAVIHAKGLRSVRMRAEMESIVAALGGARRLAAGGLDEPYEGRLDEWHLAVAPR